MERHVTRIIILLKIDQFENDDENRRILRQKMICRSFFMKVGMNENECVNRLLIIYYLDSDDSEECEQRSQIQTRSVTAAATKRDDESIDDDEEIESESESNSEQSPVIQQPKTRMVTRQMSLIINNQSKSKAIVKILPFVDHSEDSLR